MSDIENPFPREAVATNGPKIRHSAKLRVMSELQDEVVTYLSSYETPARRYGATIGIYGEHGSGKTHILSWLEARGNEIRRSDCAILYVKVDSARILDIYQKVIRKIDRTQIIDLLQRALLTIAKEEARAAKVTESVDARLGGDLDVLHEMIDEGSLDRSRLENLLQKRLEEVAQSDLVRTLLDCAGSAGDAAYHWLSGDEVTSIAPLGIVHKFSSGAASGQAVDADDIIALRALTLIATLHDLANVPLVLMIDQLEILLRTSVDRQQSLSSMIKTAIESLSAASTLVFIAGTDDGWRRFTRDVTPRLRLGQPVRIGNLDRGQTEMLIDAYVRGSTEYSKDAFDRLLELSGGSPREILRISHLAFAAHNGKLERASADAVLEYAQSSSTIADRARLALAMIDETIAGRYDQNEMRFEDGSAVDRLVRIGTVPFAAIVLLRAADSTAEATAARALRKSAERVEREWPGVRLITVTVGYASKQVNDLLKSVVTVIEFNEESFRARIETEITRAVSQGKSSDTDVTKALDAVSKRLGQIEAKRQNKDEAVDQRLEEATDKHAEAEAKQAELRTRWEIIEQLDLIDRACTRNDFDSERGLMRALLVGNEVHRKDLAIDQLGGMYLDLVTTALRQARGVAPPEPPLREIRLDLLTAMRAHLNNVTSLRRLFAEHPIRLFAYLSVGTALLSLFGLITWSFFNEPDLLERSPWGIFLRSLLIAMVIGAAVAGTCHARLAFSNPVRLWRVRAGRLLPPPNPYLQDVSRDDTLRATGRTLMFVQILALLLTGVGIFVATYSANYHPFLKIPAAAMVLVSFFVAWHRRRPFTRNEVLNRVITVALITLAFLAFLGASIVLTLPVRDETLYTDTVATDTMVTYSETMTTDPYGTLDTIGTYSTDTSGTGISTETSGTIASTTT